MVLGVRAWWWIVAFGGALACNLDTSGLGGGDTASVDPTEAGTTGGSSTGSTTGTSSGSSTDGAVDTTAASTGGEPATVGSTTASVDTDDTSSSPVDIERCSTPDLLIPDNDDAGVYSPVDIPTSGAIVELRVVVRVTHGYVGDLDVELTKDGTTVLLIDNPGDPQYLCSGDDIDVVLRDDAAVTADEACMDEGGATPALSGDVQPAAPLGPAFIGEDMAGNWRLHVIDRAMPDSGTLTEWCLQITYR